MSLEDSQRSERSVTSSLIPELHSLAGDRLEQFAELEEDVSNMEFLYDSNDESEESSSDSEEDKSSCSSIEESILPTKGPWLELCDRSKFASDTPYIPSKDDTSDLVSFFLSKLGHYTPEDEDSEGTDSGYNIKEADLVPLLSLETSTTSLAPYVPSKRDSDLLSDILEDDTTKPKYYYKAKELLTSERTYVQSIRLVEKVLHGAVKAARDTKKPVLPEIIRKKIFLNIGEIYALNSNLLEELEDRMLLWDADPESSKISDILLTRGPFFKLYSMYTSRFDLAQELYLEALKKYKSFGKLVELIEDSHLCKGLPITSFMMCPIQRVPRYKLLLEAYNKKLPDDHLDKDDTTKALHIISEVADYLNDTIKQLEQQAQLVKLQELFVDEVLVAPSRKFYLRGPAHSLSGKKLQKKKLRVLFLFSDIFIVAKITNSIKFKTKYKLPLKNVQVSAINARVLANGFCISTTTSVKPYRFMCGNVTERDKWVQYTKIAVTKEVERRSSFKSAKLSQLLGEPNRSVKAMFYDPSFEPRQPICCRMSARGRRIIVSPTHNGDGLEEVDGDETDGGSQEMLKMALMWEEHNLEGSEENSKVLEPGLDNTLSGYARYCQDGDSPSKRWLVLTYTALMGYSTHKNDSPLWALPLSGCEVQPTEDDKYTLKLSSPVGEHTISFSNEYDFILWSKTLKELLESDLNKRQ